MSDANSGARLVFLGGAPRSGTTLVQNMLDSHSTVLGGPEFLHLPDIVALGRKLHGSVDRGWIDLICSHGAVDDRIRELISGFLLPFADKYGAQLLSEKTPENVLIFRELLTLYPSARFIHVVRDPRATVASLLTVGKTARKKGDRPAPFTADSKSAIGYVRRCLEAGFKAAELAPDRVYTLVYENLVRNPVEESQKLCDFLGVPWESTMLQPGERKHLGEAAITRNSNELWYDAQTYYSNPNCASLDKWKSTLTAHQKIAVHYEFGSSVPLKRLGYDLSVSDMGRGSRIHGIAAYTFDRVRSSLRHRFRRLLATVP